MQVYLMSKLMGFSDPFFILLSSVEEPCLFRVNRRKMYTVLELEPVKKTPKSRLFSEGAGAGAHEKNI